MFQPTAISSLLLPATSTGSRGGKFFGAEDLDPAIGAKHAVKYVGLFYLAGFSCEGNLKTALFNDILVVTSGHANSCLSSFL